MKTYILTLCCLFSVATVHAACNSNMPASTPDSQLIDNSDGTVTDNKTGLMWKKCVEGVSGNSCETSSPSTFTWQQALQQPEAVNVGGGFAGHTDWRLPNIKELRSIVEERCYSPAINAVRFPNTPSSDVWSGSPYSGGTSDRAWSVNFFFGNSAIPFRSDGYAVRLVRGGQ